MSTPTNQFLNGTKISYYRANTFFADAHSRLVNGAKKEVQVQPLLDRTTPLYKEWNTQYTTWLASKGTYGGNTDTWESITNELSATKYTDWKAAIIAAGIGTKSATYKMLLPNGHKFFQTGRYERRTAEVKTLLTQFDTLKETDYTTLQWSILAACKTDIATFYDKMTSARNTQQESEKNAADAPIELKQAHTNLCNMLYRNLGLLMDLYPDSPEKIDAFYEWETLKGKQKSKSKNTTATE